jgi:hypothetical protein
MKFFLRILCLSLLASNALGQETELYVVDIGPNRGPPWQVIKYDENGQNPEVFIDTELDRPQDIVFLENEGSALVSNLISGRITKYDATTGAFIGDFATDIGQPTRMEIGADNLLYVLQWAGNGRVWRYGLDGSFVDEFTSVAVTNSIGMDWDSQGNLYVASFDARHVRKFDSDGNDLGLFVTSSLQGPTNIWFERNGDLLVMDWSGRAIRRFNSSGVFQSNFVQGLSEPEGIEFLSNGDILVGNGGTSSVRQYDGNGIFVKDFIPSGSGGLAKPNALRFRQVSNFQFNAGLNGNWWNGLDRNGEGVQVEVSDGGDGSLILVATIYSYDNMGNQIFLIAVGTVNGDTAEVDVFITEGGVWGDDFDPELVNETQWGTGTFSTSGCEAMHMALRPNAEFQGMGYTDLTYGLVRLTTPAVPCPLDNPD